MNGIGEKIKALRKNKGLSQEALAELAKVNLRTIQRIENNKNEPRGNTLHLICEALDVNAEDILDYGKSTDNNYLMFFHLSVLSFLVIPLGNIILPLILWLTKKDKIIGLKTIGVNLLNFQIIWTVLTSISLMSYTYCKIMHYDNYKFLIYIFLFLYLLNFISPLVLAYKIRQGNDTATYPSTIKIIK